jgi:hypothetical protein
VINTLISHESPPNVMKDLFISQQELARQENVAITLPGIFNQYQGVQGVNSGFLTNFNIAKNIKDDTEIPNVGSGEIIFDSKHHSSSENLDKRMM